MNDDFYIGWESKSPPGVIRFAGRVVGLLLLLVAGIAFILAAAQHTIGVSDYEWGSSKSFSGVLVLEPYPRLLVPRPGAKGSSTAFSTYLLVAPFKFGLDHGKLRALDGRTVSLHGALVYRGDQTMVEVLPDSIKPVGSEPVFAPPAETVHLGRRTFTGEIVDSKCFLGVMNPGRLIPHRACAIRCISGGIPPALVVRETNGVVKCFLLVSADGKPVNQEVLDLVAEPVEITGEVERQGDSMILRADPTTYRRVN